MAGDELDAYIKENGPFDRVCYVGDGGNDFCPILRLRECVPCPLLSP
jgi:pyridoxal phosphate phosphatase PHOSPHO2